MDPHEAVLSIYYSNQIGWHLLLGVAGVALLLWYTQEEQEWWNAIPKRRGRMLRRARRNWVRQDAIDAFVNHVEERVYARIYSRKEASELYRDARKYWPVKDLFPSPELLKENIRKRLAAHNNEAVPLVDKKEKAQPKHMFDKPVKA